ncbi:MAG: polyphenol oxidase family protein [Acidobacteria bacterium]|nr:polyphenol oxidase family protein [Acidobacteriota bacterium]
MEELTYPTPPQIVAGTVPAQTADREKELKYLAQRMGFDRTFFVNQVHSGTVLHCKDNQAGENGDAAVCRESGTLLGVFTADCVPVLIYGNKITGFIHAGWRGFRENIFAHFFLSVPKEPENIHAIIGPAVCGNCYEIGPETADFFKSPELSRKTDGSFHLDLPALTYTTLLAMGVLPENIYLSTECTCCGPGKFHSHRRNSTLLRNISFIGQENGKSTRRNR